MSDPLDHVLPVVRQVIQRLDDDVSLAALARVGRRSPFELHRAFRRVTGETTKRYTTRLRLDRAAAALLASQRSILEIALDCGFGSHEVFCRAFLRRFGMSPRAYRARGRVTGLSKAVLARHTRVVREAGPCIGLHHPEPRSSVMSASSTSSASSSTSSTGSSGASGASGSSGKLVVSRQQRDPLPALVSRGKCTATEIAQTIGQLLPSVFQHAMQHGLPFAGPPFVRYLSAGPGLLSLEAGLPIAAAIPGAAQTKDIVAIELPGGPAAVAIHEGAYDRLHETHVAIERWIDAEGLTRDGAPWEVYLTDPGDTPDPKDWRTEVVYPLA